MQKYVLRYQAMNIKINDNSMIERSDDSKNLKYIKLLL